MITEPTRCEPPGGVPPVPNCNTCTNYQDDIFYPDSECQCVDAEMPVCDFPAVSDVCKKCCWFEGVCIQSPIVVDIDGNGFALTDAANGVSFDLNSDGLAEDLSWTAANSDDAWLALDRNGNGTIDNGKELFGNVTEQTSFSDKERNGFLALAEFDRPAVGGNNDWEISASDSVFGSLRLWQDMNHNGVSEPSELKSLSQLGLVSIDLRYKKSKRTDEHGNQFKYRAKIKDVHRSQLGRWAWDVFLQTAN